MRFTSNKIGSLYYFIWKNNLKKDFSFFLNFLNDGYALADGLS